VLHEVNMAKIITAKEMVFTKEMVFNIGLFPVELLIELILRAARTQRCAGEGELMFGFTNHGPMLPERSPGCQYTVFGGFGRLRLGLPEIHPVRLIKFRRDFSRRFSFFSVSRALRISVITQSLWLLQRFCQHFFRQGVRQTERDKISSAFALQMRQRSARMQSRHQMFFVRHHS
jgi:hypothetical protein